MRKVFEGPPTDCADDKGDGKECPEMRSLFNEEPLKAGDIDLRQVDPASVFKKRPVQPLKPKI